MPSNHLILCCPLLLPPSIIPSIKVFSNESILHQVTKVLMGRAMFSKSLTQFSVDGQGCVPSLLFDLRPKLVEVMKIMATSFKRSHEGTATVSAPTLQQATADPHFCWRLLDTHGLVWVSLLWGHCSFLLGPGAHKVLFVLSKSLSKLWFFQ